MAERAGQLPLGIRLRDAATFDNFFPGTNLEVVSVLRTFAQSESGGSVLLWGAPGSGRTHLLQAVCHLAGENGARTGYLPLAELQHPEILEGWEDLDLVCLDDVDAVSAEAGWEREMFVLYEALHANGGRLLVSARAPAGQLGLQLRDLTSRLGWGVTLRLESLDDEGRRSALRLRAQRRGLILPDETAEYLLRHHVRDFPKLMQLLERLDLESLAAGRRLTVPFVKTILADPH